MDRASRDRTLITKQSINPEPAQTLHPPSRSSHWLLNETAAKCPNIANIVPHQHFSERTTGFEPATLTLAKVGHGAGTEVPLALTWPFGHNSVRFRTTCYMSFFPFLPNDTLDSPACRDVRQHLGSGASWPPLAVPAPG